MKKAVVRQLMAVDACSVNETERAGAEFAAFLQREHINKTVVALFGDIGAGKTAFVRGAVSLIVPGAVVQSPTYAIVREYRNDSACVYHFDMYRVEEEDSLESIDFWGYLAADGICFIEWSENIVPFLPEKYYRVTLTAENRGTAVANPAGGAVRKIVVEQYSTV